jgi:hypothetical protein
MAVARETKSDESIEFKFLNRDTRGQNVQSGFNISSTAPKT